MNTSKRIARAISRSEKTEKAFREIKREIKKEITRQTNMNPRFFTDEPVAQWIAVIRAEEEALTELMYVYADSSLRHLLTAGLRAKCKRVATARRISGAI